MKNHLLEDHHHHLEHLLGHKDHHRLEDDHHHLDHCEDHHLDYDHFHF
jgi:hypothetical protein